MGKGSSTKGGPLIWEGVGQKPDMLLVPTVVTVSKRGSDTAGRQEVETVDSQPHAEARAGLSSQAAEPHTDS